MATLGDFDVGAVIGRSRPRHDGNSEFGDSDVARVVHRSSGAVLAMKRIEVGPDPARAKKLLLELTRSAELAPHGVWLQQYPEHSFVHEYVDSYNVKHARCCIVEELADQSLEADIIERAVQNEPFAGLFSLWAALLHGLQAFHAQGMKHRGICQRNIFFKDRSVKFGAPAPEVALADEGYYASGGVSVSYSADIFALGLVFLEMALLHKITDLVAGGPSAALLEVKGLRGGVDFLRSWLFDKCGLLGLSVPEESVLEVLGAMLAPDPAGRPTTDDLLEWPCFAAYVDAARLVPVWQRPCVVMAQRCEGVDLADVPRRCLVSFPGFHQIFSREGAEVIERERKYSWCGEEHSLWWFAGAEPALVVDTTDVPALETEPPDPLPMDGIVEPLTAEAATAIGSRAGEHALTLLMASAAAHRAGGRPLAAEILYRAALAVDEDGNFTGAPAFGLDFGGSSQAWLGLAAVLVERGHLMPARQCYARAMARLQEEDATAGGVPAAVRDTRLFGLSEIFGAVESVGAAASGGEGAMRAAHVALYFRSTVASEAGDWEVLAALGEFYRLVGCPAPALDKPEPDMATALSYFEQAKTMCPDAIFVSQRLPKQAAKDGEDAA